MMSSRKEDYEQRYELALKPLAESLKKELDEHLAKVERIDRISARPKSIEKFLIKAAEICENGKSKYSDPLKQIQDQIGARVVTFYLDDVEVVEEVILKYYRPIEQKIIVPDSDNKFGYVGKHLILLIPSDLEPDGIAQDLIPTFFELQIKTLFQHAWAEANHDLSYKPPSELGSEQQRKVAFTAAQAWGADMIFNQLQQELQA